MYVFIKEGAKPVATAQKGMHLGTLKTKMNRVGYSYLGEIGATWGAVSNDFISLMDDRHIATFTAPKFYTVEAQLEVLTIKVRTLEMEC